MELSKDFLLKNNACAAGMAWYADNTPGTVEEAIAVLLSSDEAERYSWSNWLISKALNISDKIRYACYAAGQAIDIFEKLYPDDNRPRKAIEGAQKYFKNPPIAAEAARAARAAEAAGAAWAAEAAARAAEAAARAAGAAGAAWENKILGKIINYGLLLLTNGETK